jgi:subtilisin family serine protease
MTLRFWPTLLLIVAGAVHAQPAPESGAGNTRILLMLQSAPVHYRPDAAYAGGYRAGGRATRKTLARELALEQGLSLREDWAMPVLGLDCYVLEAGDPASAARAISALARDPRIASVQPMQRFHVLAATAPGPDPLYPAQPAATRWHLSELHRRATGLGVRIAVIDTGVAIDHPDLRGQVAVNRDFVDAGAPVAEAHGTEVAGIIAARAGNGIGIAGIAPQARLLVLRACWQQGTGPAQCDSFTLAKALQFAIMNRAQVLNLSLGGAYDPLLARLLDIAVQRGITVVAAVDPDAELGGFPASHAGVLAVIDMQSAYTGIPAFRVAGHGVPATIPGGGWAVVDGSSFAAAQLSGLVALVRQQAPRMQNAQMRMLLATTTTSPPRAGADHAVDVDACAVLSRLDQACVCNCAIVSATMGAPLH